MNIASQRIVSIGKLICTLLLSCSAALAREATLDMGVGHFAHRAWTIGEGVTNAPIHAFAQTPDGYLWLGTPVGLLRFDGVRAVPWRAPDGQHLPDNWINSLLATHDGTLWIGTSGGLASWRDGKLTAYSALAGLDILALLVDRQGTVWAGTESRATSTGRLCAIRGNLVHCYGKDGSLGARIYCLYEDRGGSLWFTSSSGTWRWRPGKPKLYPMPDTITGYFQSLTSDTDSGVLVSGHDGLRKIVDGEVRTFPLPGVLPQGPPPWMLTDRDGALWLGTIGNGLRYVHGGRMDSFEKSDGLSGDQVMRMFEDREGSVWVATKNGLDEFWKIATARFPGETELSDGNVTSVLVDVDGGIWFAIPTGLYRQKDGEMTVYRGHASKSAVPLRGTALPAAKEIIINGLPTDTSGSLYQDRRGRIWLGSSSGLGYLQNDRFVAVKGVPGGWLNCITEDDLGNLWVAHRALGLLRITRDGEVKRFTWTDLGIGETWSIVFDPSRKGLWLGSALGEIAFFKDGKIRASHAASGPGKRGVRDFRLDPDGTLWAATEGGLIRLKNGQLATLNSENGLPCDIVHGTIRDNAGSLWIYTACGLVRIARSDLDTWSRGTLGKQALRTLVMNASDGVRSEVWRFSPKIAKTLDGRLWLATSTGPMTVDPRNIPRNALRPPVHIEQLVADRQTYDASSTIRLPPLVRDIEIDYTALSLVAPEKNRFRYRLEGHDRDWQDAGNRRQAYYTDLPPDDYRFRVIASNNSGVWNMQGASLAFSIAPAYWQATWFQILVATTLALLLATVYRIRMRQVARAAAHEQEIELRHRALQTELAHANRVATMGQLTASIAHEVNQPIAATITNAKAALRWLAGAPPDLEEVCDALARIARDGDRAGEIIGRIRALAKNAPPQKDRLNINDAIREVIDLTHGEALKNDVSVRTDLADGLPPVYGDRVQLQQVMLNLTVNAIQAMADVNDGARELFISTAKAEPGVLITVRDTGPGLPPAMLDRLFEAFQTTKPGGLGLGLSICHSIVEAHGGELTAKANAPRGAVFQFTVPVQEERLGSDR